MVKKIALETEMDIERVKIELKTSAKQRERNLKDMTVIRKELLKLKEVGSSQQLEVENLQEIIEKVTGQVVEVDERVTREIEVREKSVEEIRVRVQDQKDELIDLSEQLEGTDSDVAMVTELVQQIVAEKKHAA